MVVTSAASKFGKPLFYTFIQFVTVAVLALPLAAWHEDVKSDAIMAAAHRFFSSVALPVPSPMP